jgi:hypothetical protein
MWSKPDTIPNAPQQTACDKCQEATEVLAVRQVDNGRSGFVCLINCENCGARESFHGSSGG